MLTSTEVVKEYLDTAYRYRWLIVLPLVLALGSTAALVRWLPEVYRASTTILVVRQSLPEEIARSTVTTEIQDRMASLAVQVLSRKYLEKIAIEFGFVGPEATDKEIEEASAQLHRSVRVNFDRRSLSYFEIVVQDEVPRRAAQVANRLAELFIEQNSELRQAEATSTLRQVERWLDENNGALDGEEQRIAAYRRERIWELPERLETNIALLQTTQQQLDTMVSEIQIRAGQLDSLRAQAQGLAPIASVTTAEDEVLARLRSDLARLLRTRTEAHPSVAEKRREIAEYERIRSDVPVNVPGVDDEQNARSESLDAELLVVKRELANLEQDRERLVGQLELYQGRIDRTPLREQELAGLSRELRVLQANNDSLLGKKEAAEQARDLETAKQGEHFQVQDPARVPSRPFKPQPLLILAANLAGALILGVGIAFVTELLGQTIRTEVEFRRHYRDLPLLACIPHVEDQPRRRRRRRRLGRSAAMWCVLAASIGMLLW